MTSQGQDLYEFGPFRLDVTERLLQRDGQAVPLAPKVFDTLLVLVRHNGHLVRKDKLLEEVWPDTFVEEVNLAVNVSTLRKVLGEMSSGQPYIETVSKQGYRFTAAVRESENHDDDPIIHQRLRARIVAADVDSRAPDQRSSRAVTAIDIRAGSQWVAQRMRTLSLVLAGCLLLAGIGVVLHFHSRPSTTSASPARLNSIAVLPFKPLSENSDDQHLELGLTDDLINRLSRLKQLVVRPTSAVRRYTNVTQDPIAAGKDLKVDSVLEGSIQRLGDRIRVSVRLVKVDDGRALWSGTFDESVRDVFTLEDGISSRVAVALAPQLSGEDLKLVTRHEPESPEAHEAYLKGRYFWNRRTEEDTRKAIESFQQAIKLDPAYAMAYSGLADCYLSLYDYQFSAPEEVVPKARIAAARALELDETMAEPHASLARIKWLYDHDRAAEKDFLRATELNPNYATARQWYGRYLADVGRFDEAIAEVKRAQELDPVSLAIGSSLGVVLFYARRYDQSMAQLQRTIELEANFQLSHWLLANVYERKQMYREAVGEYQKALNLQDEHELAAAIGESFDRGGFPAATRTLMNGTKLKQKTEPGYSFTLARYAALLGDKEQAFEWLDTASRYRHPWLVQLRVDPQFDGLRSDARFAELLRREHLGE
jgi:TolB-like protein/DNA-binding winged helix-turn-helix (wHTH) protein/tetratricopeptide (TPR) repeat protein